MPTLNVAVIIPSIIAVVSIYAIILTSFQTKTLILRMLSNRNDELSETLSDYRACLDELGERDDVFKKTVSSIIKLHEDKISLNYFENEIGIMDEIQKEQVLITLVKLLATERKDFETLVMTYLEINLLWEAYFKANKQNALVLMFSYLKKYYKEPIISIRNNAFKKRTSLQMFNKFSDELIKFA